MKWYRYLLSFAFVAVLLGLFYHAVHAHTRVEIGPYAVVVGWRTEPPIIGERNAITIEITEGGEPVEDAEATLDVELLYAGRTFRVNLSPTATPGLYMAELFPTVRGQYEVRFFGTLGELEIDETLEPEEVFPASRIQFPEPQPDPRDLQQQIEVLSNQLQTARTAAFVGIGVGALGLFIAVFSLLRRRL